MRQKFTQIGKIKGELSLPGDKSISHRSVMFSALADGKSEIYNLSNGEDVKSTMSCFMQLGVEIKNVGNHVEVLGNGFKGLKKPSRELDAGNSGTTTRLISGILSAQKFESILTGDESLSKRDMKRIIEPLTKMGAKIESLPTAQAGSERFTLPLKIIPAKEIIPIEYELPISSAQVKSAVLLAGLHSEKITTVIETTPSRNHTEKMLGLKTEKKDGKIYSFVSKENYPKPDKYIVPSDISTASFFIVLALLSKNSQLRIKNLLLNQTRTGVLNVLTQMGAEIEMENVKKFNNEDVGDLVVYSSKLKNIVISKEIIPNIIDEIPILSIAGIFAEDEFKISGAKELRHKESDRIKSICDNLKEIGLNVDGFEDGFAFSGDITKSNPSFESYGDHRIAMAFGILCLLLKDGGNVNNFNCVNISNPDFLNQLKIITRN